MISAEQFLKILAEKDLLPSAAVRKLLKQVEQSSPPISAKRVAKRLVEKGYLTPALVKRLLTAAEDEAAPTGPAPEESTLSFAPEPKEAKEEEEEDLGLAPLDVEKRKDAPIQANQFDLYESAGGAMDELEPMPGESAIYGLVKPSSAPRPAPKTPSPRVPRTPPPTPPRAEVMMGQIVSGEIVSEGRSRVRSASRGDAAEEESFGPPRRQSGLVRLWRTIVPQRDRRRKENVWDSSLILVGGGLLLLLCIMLVALVWWFYGQSGDQVLLQADRLYEEQSYTKAIDQYTQYLDKYATGDKKASLARVRRGMARLRQAVESSTNYAASLDVAQQVLGEIRSEDAFADVKPELKGVLPGIAEGLAKQARDKTSSELVAKTREAIELIETYIASQQRNKAQMDDILASLAMTERDISRDSELAKAVAAIEQATAQQKADEAYAVRKSLLRTYPDLANDAKLAAAILKVSASQQEVVEMVAEAKPAEQASPAGPVATTVAVARQKFLKQAPSVKGAVVYALAEGAAYGLDAATGRVLWRRFVGANTGGASLPYPPTPLGIESGSDALLVDAAASALDRVEATTGRPRWRAVLGQRFTAEPVVDGERILVATQSGRLVVVEVASGNSPGYMRLPQPLRVAPVVDPKRGRLYQIADHSNLYVLSKDGRCEQVVYLAHEPGSIIVPPVVLSEFLVVAENRGLDRSTLRVFTLDAKETEKEKEKTPAFRELQQIDLEGRVDVKPLVAGARLLVTTDRGCVIAYRLSGLGAREPLEMVARQQTSQRPDVVRFPLLVQNQFWIADDHLTKYMIQESMAGFDTQWVTCKDSAFRQPIVALGQTIYLVRRRMGLPGVMVTAMAMDKPTVYWETTLATPLVAEPLVREPAAQEPADRVEVVTALGGVVDVRADKMKGSVVVDRAVVSLDSGEAGLAVHNAIRTPDGLLALFTGPGSDKINVFDPKATPQRFRDVILPSPAAATPVAVAGGLLVPSREGLVFLIHPRTGAPMAEPFQPPLAPGQKIQWRQPAVADAQSVVMADGRKHLYRLGLRDQPQVHLAALDQAETTSPIVSDLAVVGQVVYAVDAEGNLLHFTLPKLVAGKSVPLGGAPAWGPRQVGSRGFLATDDDQLLCLDGEGNVVWKVALLHGPLAGTPLLVGDHVLVASAGGTVSRIDAASGKETAKLETGFPLAAGPVLLGEQLLLTGGDGTLYQVKQP